MMTTASRAALKTPPCGKPCPGATVSMSPSRVIASPSKGAWHLSGLAEYSPDRAAGEATRVVLRALPPLGGEDLLRLVEGCALQRGLVAEVADAPGLAHPEVIGQPADRHALQTLDRGRLDRPVDDGCARLRGLFV